MSKRAEASTLPGSVIWLLVAMSLVWGGNWPIMKLVLAEMPALSFRAFCLDSLIVPRAKRAEFGFEYVCEIRHRDGSRCFIHHAGSALR